MAFEPYLGGELPNIVDVTKGMNPDGTPAKIAEVLTQYNPIIEDIPMVEGNLPTGHRTTIRADLPTPTWRRLNYGVRPTKSAKAQVDDTIGMLEDYGEVDKDLAKLNDNTAEFRMSEDEPHLESMSNTMASTIFYGDTGTHPERFLGLAPRYGSLYTGDVPADKFTAEVNSAYLKHIIDAGEGTPTTGELTSVWYICWGANRVHGIYPKGSEGGLIGDDLGEQTLYDNDGGRFQGYRTHYQWKMGLCVRDWRNVVRICNIELSKMTTAAAQTLLYQSMIKARYTVPSGAKGIFYASPGVLAMLDIAAVEKSNAALGYQNVFGQDLLTFRGTPIKGCSAILETEALVS